MIRTPEIETCQYVQYLISPAIVRVRYFIKTTTRTFQASPRAGASVQPCIPTEAKRETEEILNAILPPKEWEEDGQIWTQKVSFL